MSHDRLYARGGSGTYVRTNLSHPVTTADYHAANRQLTLSLNEVAHDTGVFEGGQVHDVLYKEQRIAPDSG